MQQTFDLLGTIRCCATGAVVSMSPKHIYRLDRGMMKMVQVNYDGMQRLKYLLMPGDLFGSLAYLMNGSGDYPEEATALQFVQLSVLSLENVNDMCEADPHFESTLLETIGKRIIKMERRLDAMVFMNSEQRIISFLDEFFCSYGNIVDHKCFIPNLLTHFEIATLTGTSRQTVTRIMNGLRKQGFIDYDTENIILCSELPLIKSHTVL